MLIVARVIVWARFHESRAQADGTIAHNGRKATSCGTGGFTTHPAFYDAVYHTLLEWVLVRPGSLETPDDAAAMELGSDSFAETFKLLYARHQASDDSSVVVEWPGTPALAGDVRNRLIGFDIASGEFMTASLAFRSPAPPLARRAA